MGERTQVHKTTTTKQHNHSIHPENSEERLPERLGSHLAYSPTQILQMQRLIGNRAVLQLLRAEPKEAEAPRKTQAPPPRVIHRMPHVHLMLQRKMREMKLDFIKMKRKDAHIGLAILKNMGKNVGPRDLYGHWWTEVGDLLPGNNWQPTKSYGWWPETSVDLKKTLNGVPGKLNKGLPRDPHHGEDGEVAFHPTMMVDDKSDYDTVRAQVEADVDAFARGFTGTWNWRGPWGKNCHTFQDRLKKKLKLHHRESKYTFRDPKQTQAEAQAQADKAAKDKADQHQRQPEPYQMVTLPGFIDIFVDDARYGIQQAGMTRPGQQIGLTDVVKPFGNHNYMRIKIERNWVWVMEHDLMKLLPQNQSEQNQGQEAAT